MEPYQIILLIVVIVSFIYVSIVVYVMTQMNEFKSRLKKRRRGLGTLLYERSNILRSIIALFEKEGVTFTEEDKACFASFDALTFKKYDDDAIREEAELVKMTTSRLKYLAQANRWACKHESFEGYVDLLKDLERNYRIVVSKYNMDVGAYNYWIAVPTVSWVGWLVGFRKKSTLS